MKILFIHQNFPAQFRHLAPALRARGNDVRALAVQGGGLPGIDLLRHTPRKIGAAAPHPWLADLETKVLRGASALQSMLDLSRKGWNPDLVVAHPAWGEALFVKEVWPRTKLLCFLEFYYASSGRDVDFDPEFGLMNLESKARLRLKNLAHLQALDTMDHGLSPTRWQRSTFPEAWQNRIDVIFDGVDTRLIRPNPQAQLQIRTEKNHTLTLSAGDEVITYAARHLEPYRGYHQFIRALPHIQAARPSAITLIVGGHGYSYGTPPPAGTTWQRHFLDEVRDKLDLSRIFFLGALPYDQYLNVLQVSACHVYLTYPFVLSWSCVEAMAAGCLIVGSRTAPVEEIIQHGQNGLLTDFFDHRSLAAQVTEVLQGPQDFQPLREHARKVAAERYDLHGTCLPAQIRLINDLLKG